MRPVSTFSKTAVEIGEKRLGQTPGAPSSVDSAAVEEIASRMQRIYPDMTEKDAVNVIVNAVLLHQVGLMHAAIEGSLHDKKLVFPSAMVTLRTSNLGGRIARNVDVVLEGEFQVAEDSIQGMTEPSSTQEEALGEKRTRLTYHFDRLPVGDEYGSVISLWVSVPEDIELAPPTWLDAKVMHDDGAGTGRVVDGVTRPSHSPVLRAMGDAMVGFGLGVLLLSILQGRRIWRRQAEATGAERFSPGSSRDEDT